MKTPLKDRARIKRSVIAFYITEKDKNDIEKIASERGLTLSALLRMLVINEIERSKKIRR